MQIIFMNRNLNYLLYVLKLVIILKEEVQVLDWNIHLNTTMRIHQLIMCHL